MSTATATAASNDSKVIVPTKSAEDKREYRIITLSNKLQALLIHDADTDKSAAAMDVNVGHFCDPDHAPGLAHFLEHMLFLGTKRYPKENEYSEYLSQHGGASNAYTAMENTNYYFDITHPYLEGALDRFSQFFVAPLFTETATDRELTAVHNEHGKNIQQDPWRLYQLLKSTSNPKHPFSKFATGSLETLKDLPKSKGIDTRSEMLKFHEQFYSASIMKLSVLGRESLDQLEKWVREKFSDIRNNNVTRPKFGEDALLEDSLQRTYKVVPMRDVRQLQIGWPASATRPHYKSKPSSLLSHLLGHEGEGSLLSYLKQKGWVNSLNAGENQDASSFSVFGVTLDLSPEGMSHTDEIVQTVYQYIDLLKKATDDDWKLHFTESSEISSMGFRFKSTEHPSSYVSSTAGDQHVYAPFDILAGPWIYETFNPSLVRSFVNCLTVKNSRVHLIAKAFEGKTDKKETWYKTDYAEEKYTDEQIKLWSAPGTCSALVLPKRNSFIATDFSLRSPPSSSSSSSTSSGTATTTAADDLTEIKSSSNATRAAAAAASAAAATTTASAGDAAYPTLVSETVSSKLWYKLDTTFKKPKLALYVSITLPAAFSSPTNYSLTQLYCSVLNDALNEFSYDADVAGLRYSLSADSNGLTLALSGYNHKLPLLLKVVLEKMRSLVIKQDRFDILKEKMVRGIKNFNLEQPYSIAAYETGLYLEQRVWTNKERLAALDTLTYTDLQKFIDVLLATGYTETLVHGNAALQEAKELHKLIGDVLALKPAFASQLPDYRVVQLKDGHSYYLKIPTYNPNDTNSCAMEIYQVDGDVVALAARMSLLGDIGAEPAFDQLRTKETLGYIVWSGGHSLKGVLGYRVIVQSAQYSASYLDARIEAYLNKFRTILASMPTDRFDKHRTAVIAKKQEKDKSLYEEAGRHWHEITRHRYSFNRTDLEVAELQKLTQDDLVAFFDTYVMVNSARRRKFSVQVFGKQWDPATPSTTLPAPEQKNGVAATTAAAPAADAAAAPAAATDKAATADASKDKEAAEPLPPAPTDESTVVELTDYMKFKRSMPLFPSFM